jgi:hypothetical protein
MKSPVASSSICRRSKALGLNFQSNPSRVLLSAKHASRMRLFHRTLVSSSRRRAEEMIEEVEQRQALLLGFGEESIQSLGLKWDAQSLAVVQAAVM